MSAKNKTPVKKPVKKKEPLVILSEKEIAKVANNFGKIDDKLCDLWDFFPDGPSDYDLGSEPYGNETKEDAVRAASKEVQRLRKQYPAQVAKFKAKVAALPDTI